MGTSILFDKTYGCLAGAALGDAVGSLTEAWDYRAVQRKWGKITGLVGEGEPRPSSTCARWCEVRAAEGTPSPKWGTWLASARWPNIFGTTHRGNRSQLEEE